MCDGDRGATDVDLTNLAEAAKRIALAKNIAVFHGWQQAAIAGITEASPHPAITHSKGVERYPQHVAKQSSCCSERHRRPRALGLGPEDYTAVIETSEHGGYPLFDHLRKSATARSCGPRACAARSS